MRVLAIETATEALTPWREDYVREMNCQVVHDSLHRRAGWTHSYLLRIGGEIVGYGAVLVGGPWSGTRTVFEFYVAPRFRADSFLFFDELLATTKATHVLSQTNDALLTTLLHARTKEIVCDKILFSAGETTSLPTRGAAFRRVQPADTERMFTHQLEPVGDYVLEFEGAVIATGGVLFHYNRPFGDVFFEVAAAFRRRGFGAYLAQELKRACRELGSVPCARCSPKNVASLHVCRKAGFEPRACMVTGEIGR